MGAMVINEQRCRPRGTALNVLVKTRWFRFLLAGGTNTVISQSVLLLLLGWMPVAAATLLSQLVHGCCGYATSARAVFGCQGSPWRYGALFGLSWLVQWLALAILLEAGLPRLQAVVVLVPVLALSSYVLQRQLVFR